MKIKESESESEYYNQLLGREYFPLCQAKRPGFWTLVVNFGATT